MGTGKSYVYSYTRLTEDLYLAEGLKSSAFARRGLARPFS